MNPSASIDRSTRSRVRSLTRSGRLSTLDTVPSDTAACAATSFMLGEAPSRTGPPRCRCTTPPPESRRPDSRSPAVRRTGPNRTAAGSAAAGAAEERGNARLPG
ncbi:hypothetical protein GCM10027440_01930 [Nocardiopsis coralliicola]